MLIPYMLDPECIKFGASKIAIFLKVPLELE